MIDHTLEEEEEGKGTIGRIETTRPNGEGMDMVVGALLGGRGKWMKYVEVEEVEVGRLWVDKEEGREQGIERVVVRGTMVDTR